MYLLGKEKSRLSNELIFQPEFKRQTDLLLGLFHLSRVPENRNNGEVIFEIQRGIGSFIRHFEGSLKIAIKTAKETGVKEWNNDINIFAHKRLIRIARTIMDGIVWRNIGYRKTWAIMLSHNKRNGLNDDFEKLLEVAYCFSPDYVSIIGDLTETVRIGDLIFINEQGFPLITEAKEGKDGKLKLYNCLTVDPKKLPSKQLSKVLDTQEIISSGEVERLDVKIEDIESITPYRYLEQVQHGILLAGRDGHWTGKLNKFVSVRIIDSEKIGSVKEKNKLSAILDKAKRIISDVAGDRLIPISNLDTFYSEETKFLKGFPPYSIFPFDDVTCMRLMTGGLQILSYVNVTGIGRFFESNGWMVEFYGSKEKELERLPNEARNFSSLFGEHHSDDTIITISKEDGYYQTIPFHEIMRLGYEFLSPKTLLETAEYLYKSRTEGMQEGRGYAFNYLKDKNIFL